jgi:hypothetical protein
MKITLEFDTAKLDELPVANLAMRADSVRELIIDLLWQILTWHNESPRDQQAEAFKKVYCWVLEEIANRGLTIDRTREGELRSRAGEMLKNRLDPKPETAAAVKEKAGVAGTAASLKFADITEAFGDPPETKQ